MKNDINIFIKAIKYCKNKVYISIPLIQRDLLLNFTEAKRTIYRLQKLCLIKLKTAKLHYEVDTAKINKLLTKYPNENALINYINNKENLEKQKYDLINLEDKYNEDTLDRWYDFTMNVETLIDNMGIINKHSFVNNLNALSQHIEFCFKNKGGEIKKCLADLWLFDNKQASNDIKAKINELLETGPNKNALIKCNNNQENKFSFINCMGIKFINDFHYLCTVMSSNKERKEKIKEMKKLLKQAKNLLSKLCHPLLFNDLHNIFLDAGAYYRTFIVDATYEEELLYDKFCNSLAMDMPIDDLIKIQKNDDNCILLILDYEIVFDEDQFDKKRDKFVNEPLSTQEFNKITIRKCTKKTKRLIK